MRSDIVKLSGDPSDTALALKQAESVAAFFGMQGKEAIHLRLLAEEMMGMIRSLTETRSAEFWIEDDEKADRRLRLHLKAAVGMNTELRKELLSASTSGKNAAAKGFSGKLRDIFARAIEPEDKYIADYYAAGWIISEPEMYNMTTGSVWSFIPDFIKCGFSKGKKLSKNCSVCSCSSLINRFLGRYTIS